MSKKEKSKLEKVIDVAKVIGSVLAVGIAIATAIGGLKSKDK